VGAADDGVMVIALDGLVAVRANVVLCGHCISSFGEVCCVKRTVRCKVSRRSTERFRDRWGMKVDVFLYSIGSLAVARSTRCLYRWAGSFCALFNYGLITLCTEHTNLEL